MAEEVLVMYAGEVVKGNDDIFYRSGHPYTHGLRLGGIAIEQLQQCRWRRMDLGIY